MYVDEYSVNNHASAIIGGGFNPEQSPFISKRPTVPIICHTTVL